VNWSRPNPELHPWERAEAERAALLRIVRIGFAVLFIVVVVLAILQLEPAAVRDVEWLGNIPLLIGWKVVVGVAMALAALVLVIEAFATQRKLGTLVGVFLGLAAALLGAYAVSKVLDVLATIYEIGPNLLVIVKGLIGIVFAYLGVTTVLQTQDDFRLVIPYVEFAKQIRGPRPLLLDTSALIDARIHDLCQTGIVQAPVVVPRFVIAELQLLADSSEKLKRGRGRRGLDLIGRLQRLPGVSVAIDETAVSGQAVDAKLVELSMVMGAIIVTADVGLSRVAEIQGVKCLNLNDVANALKPALIPGEQLSIKLIKPGEQPGQGVGYLEDGTMVVAEDGAARVGEQVTLIVTSTLQTSAGRLIFGRVLHSIAAAGGSGPAPDGRAPPAPERGHEPHAPALAPPSAAPEDGAPGEAAPGPDAAASPPDRSRGPFPPHPSRRPNPARNPRR
jgi:uncharacterized protein YacL